MPSSPSVKDASVEISHFEADLFQTAMQRDHEFVAESAAPIDYQLVPEGLFIDLNRSFESDIQILERDALHVNTL